MTWSELNPWPLPRKTDPSDVPLDELVAAQEELHRAAAARQYLGNRPQRTTEDIETANVAIEEARVRVREAKQAVIEATAQPKEE